MTLQEAQLIKRTAWANMQPRNNETPTPRQVKQSRDAVKMITYIACLNYAMYDLESALMAENKFRNNVAYYFRMAHKIVMGVHDHTYKLLMDVNAASGRAYNEGMERVWGIIDNCILLSEPSKSYSIVLALCRLIGEINKSVSTRFNLREVKSIERIPSLLAGMGEDAKVDNIISRNVQ